MKTIERMIFTSLEGSNEGASQMSTKHRRLVYQGFAEGEFRKGVAVRSREPRQPYGDFLITILMEVADPKV